MLNQRMMLEAKRALLYSGSRRPTRLALGFGYPAYLPHFFAGHAGR
jgi:hypothetical protein